MADLILELQRDCLKAELAVSGLLRKAMVVSRKLAVGEIEQWIRWELDGYPDSNSIPPYRKIPGVVRAFNPYRGWIPVEITDDRVRALYTIRPLFQSVSELEELIGARQSKNLVMRFQGKQAEFLTNMMDVQFEVALHISSASLIGVLDKVRNTVLDWALDLENRGVTGKGFSFSTEEKMAAPASSYVITNHIGTMNNSQIQQHSPGANQAVQVQNSEIESLKNFATDLIAAVDSFGLSAVSTAEILSDARALDSQANSPVPKRGIIVEALSSIRRILEGAAGELVANDFPTRASVLLGAFSAAGAS